MSDNVSYSLFVQNSAEHGYELSDLGMDWAMETEDQIPMDVDPTQYFEERISGFSDRVKDLMREYWGVSQEMKAAVIEA